MNVSTNFREISYDEAVHHPHAFSWQDPSIPAQQLALVQQEMASWVAGSPFLLFDTLKECMQLLEATEHTQTLLEVGCGVGHNALVVSVSGNFDYTGVDYSNAFLETARDWHGIGTFVFDQADALNLSDYATERNFDIVLHSACLLHILDWKAALREAAYVTGRYLILHRVVVSTRHRTQYFLKDAYGVECLEIWLDEMELFTELTKLGFDLKRVWSLGSDVRCAHHTYLLERK